MQKVFHDNRAAMQINTICAVPKGVEEWDHSGSGCRE